MILQIEDVNDSIPHDRAIEKLYNGHSDPEGRSATVQSFDRFPEFIRADFSHVVKI